MPMMTVLRAVWLTRVLKSRSEAAICAEARMPQWEARTRGRATANARVALTAAHERASEARRSTGPVYAGADAPGRGWQCVGVGDILDRGPAPRSNHPPAR